MISAIPLFPLNVVLYPGGLLPLKIFETRYLDMVTDCIKHQTVFGVVAVHAEKAQSTSSPYHYEMIGTSARIIDVDVPQPNLMMIRCSGEQRFKVNTAHQQDNGLWIGDISWIKQDQALTVPDDLTEAAEYLHLLIKGISKQGLTESQMPIQQPYHFDDCSWVANRWCEMLNISLQDKQRMLELDSPIVRLELVQDILTELTKD